MKIPTNCYVHNLTCYYTWMGADGIARTKVKQGAQVSLKDSMENSTAVNSFITEKKYPLVVDSREIKSISKEARDHFSIGNRETRINSFAIIIQSPISRIIGNLFMSFNKPSVPAKLFNTEEDAIDWLLQYL